jgi:hypothetical protein
MPTVSIFVWRRTDPGTPPALERPACLTAAEKQAAVRGAGALLAVALAVLLAADAASAFFLCLAALALVDAGVGGACGSGQGGGEGHVWWLAPLYLVFLYVLVPWEGFPVGEVDAFAFAGSV